MSCPKLLVLVISASTLSSALGGDRTAGRVLAESVCQTCHGMDGMATSATVPNIGGQQKDYLNIQLEAYRDGQRVHPQMSIVSKMLSDKDIGDVSEWYSAMRITVELPE